MDLHGACSSTAGPLTTFTATASFLDSSTHASTRPKEPSPTCAAQTFPARDASSKKHPVIENYRPFTKKTIPPQCFLRNLTLVFHPFTFRSHVFDVLEGLSPRNGMKLQLIWPSAFGFRLLLHHISASVPEFHPSRPLKMRGVPIPSACDKTWVPAPMLKDIQTWLTGKSRGKKSFEGTNMEKGPISTLIPPMRH